MYVCAARGLERHPFALAASEGRHHHIVDVAVVVCVLHFHSSEKAAQAASSASVPGAAAAGAASVTLRYAEHSVVPMTLAMMHTYLVGGRSLDHFFILFYSFLLKGGA